MILIKKEVFSIVKLLESIEIQGLYGEEEYLAKLTLIKQYGLKSIN